MKPSQGSRFKVHFISTVSKDKKTISNSSHKKSLQQWKIIVSQHRFEEIDAVIKLPLQSSSQSTHNRSLQVGHHKLWITLFKDHVSYITCLQKVTSEFMCRQDLSTAQWKTTLTLIFWRLRFLIFINFDTKKGGTSQCSSNFVSLELM